MGGEVQKNKFGDDQFARFSPESHDMKSLHWETSA